MSDAKKITTAAKLNAVRREIRMRRRVYPKLVAKGSMTQDRADHEIAVFEAIAADYEQLREEELRRERLGSVGHDLFDNP